MDMRTDDAAQSTTAATTTGDETTPDRRGRTRALLILLLVCLAIGAGLWFMWDRVWSRQETTDNAYVGADQLQITARQDGTVTAIHAHDTQRVAAGALLVELDRTDAELALEQAAGALAQTAREVRQRQLDVNQGDAKIVQRQIALAQAQSLLARRERLYASHLISVEDINNARDDVKRARADLEVERLAAANARASVNGTEIATHPAVEQARTRYVEAWVALERTRIYAPRAGEIAQRTVQLGQQITAGQALLRLVPLDDVWIDANFKENQLRHLRIGQPVHAWFDLYGKAVQFRGHVTGFSAGTGAAFALLPPLNAAGNWVKVVQRLPVRIELDPGQLQAHPLRVGLSGTVTVDIQDRSGPRLVAESAPTAQTAPQATDLRVARAAADRIIAANTTPPGSAAPP